jgi:glycosyltransferase involved in cell wall biosynthesis
VSRLKIIVEGWRFLPHSYAVVSQSLCLGLLDRGVQLFHRDVKPYRPDWTPVRGLLPPADEARIAAIPPAPDDLAADAVFRCAFPYDLTPSPQGRTFVQMTAELGMVPDQCMAGEPLGRAHMCSDAVITTPSNYCRDGLVASGADPARTAVVLHGTDPNIFSPASPAECKEVRRRLGWHNRFVFMNVGTMTENKGIDVLLKAFATVAARDPSVMLLLKGLDDLYQSGGNVATILARLGISDPAICRRIAYHGAAMNTKDLAQLYRAADAYVSPYLAEGFNMPVLEAASSGLPVICTAGGPTDEFTTAGFAHRIRSRRGPSRWGVGSGFEPDVAHTVELMTEVMEDHAFRRQARESGPAHVRAHLTWDHAAQQFLDLLSGPPETARIGAAASAASMQ